MLKNKPQIAWESICNLRASSAFYLGPYMDPGRIKGTPCFALGLCAAHRSCAPSTLKSWIRPYNAAPPPPNKKKKWIDAPACYDAIGVDVWWLSLVHGMAYCSTHPWPMYRNSCIFTPAPWTCKVMVAIMNISFSNKQIIQTKIFFSFISLEGNFTEDDPFFLPMSELC